MGDKEQKEQKERDREKDQERERESLEKYEKQADDTRHEETIGDSDDSQSER